MSDMHGMLPDVPPCDLLLLAGDITPVENHRMDFQAEWLDGEFRRWLLKQPARKIIGVAGNHDFVFEKRPDLVPRDLPWTYLEDSHTQWEGYCIYGTPWQPWFHDWAFNLSEAELERKWALIPAGVDILLLHGPPHGYGDGVPSVRDGHESVRHCGSPSLLRRIEQVQPKLAVFGHIHEDRGTWQHGPTVLANVTLVDEGYFPIYSPWEFELG
jgi:Icc-related predicted phosphoesterase